MPNPKRDLSQKPYTSNYPPLQAWLQALQARCDWRLPLGPQDEPHAYVEQWQAPGCRPFILVVHAKQHGWNVFTDCVYSTIVKTLADATKRIRASSKSAG